MAIATVIIHVRVSWWVAPYIHTLAWLCTFFGTQPDYDKVKRVLDHGIEVIKK